METASETRKRMRGTKRVCKACDARYYDLARDPAVCPACQASVPLAEFARASEPPPSGYRGSWSARNRPVHTLLPPEEVASALVDAAADEAEEKSEAAPAAEDDSILEQEEALDDDVADLLAPDGEATPND